jgi:uncharacterized membrane-anchored protein YhcB (DUF1043 family)
MKKLENFKLKTIKTGIRSFAVIIGVFAVLSYSLAALILLHGDKNLLESNVFVIILLCAPIVSTGLVLGGFLWFLRRDVGNNYWPSNAERVWPAEMTESSQQIAEKSSGGVLENKSSLVILFVAMIAVFSFSQENSTMPSAGPKGNAIVCDTVPVHVATSDYVTVDVLKDSQEFYSDSFTWLLSIVGIVVAVLIFLNVMSKMDMDKRERRLLKELKEQKKEFNQRQKEQKEEFNQIQKGLENKIETSLKEYDEKSQEKIKKCESKINELEKYCDKLWSMMSPKHRADN